MKSNEIFWSNIRKKTIRCMRRINLFLLSRFYFLLNTIIIIPAITITAVTINIKNKGGSPGTGAGVGAGVVAVEGGVMAVSYTHLTLPTTPYV